MGIFVLIGGGENGREGTSYETEKIDNEIVSLLPTKKEKNFLFIAHGNNYEKEYYEVIKKNFEKIGCKCDILYKNDLKDVSISKNKLSWANIIYIGGGNTLKMMNVWRRYKFNEILKDAKKEDKIFCGISAGAITFCKYGVSDSRKTLKYDKYIKVRGLEFFNILFCPSFDEKYNYIENIDKIMKDAKVPMFALEKGTALILNRNKSKIVKSIENKKIYKIFTQGYKKSILELTNDNISEILYK